MKILTITAITVLAVPVIALSQTTEPQQSPAQSNETQTTAPAKGKQMRVGQDENKAEATRPEAGTQTNVKGRSENATTSETGAVRSSTSQKTTVNKQEFRSRHSEVFSLGRHPKEFFVQASGLTISA